VDPESRAPFVPVTRAALHHAGEASPAAAEIAFVLESGARDGYVRYGCAYHHLDPCDREFRGGWFMFALRDAAALAGHYRSAPDAQRFYAALAAQIDDACTQRRLACGPPRSGFAPPLAPGDVARIAANAGRGALALAQFSGFELAPKASTGRESDLARQAAFLHTRAFARGDAPPEFPDRADRVRAALLRSIACGVRLDRAAVRARRSRRAARVAAARRACAEGARARRRRAARGRDGLAHRTRLGGRDHVDPDPRAALPLARVSAAVAVRRDRARGCVAYEKSASLNCASRSIHHFGACDISVLRSQ
jgi:hypothetical protein